MIEQIFPCKCCNGNGQSNNPLTMQLHKCKCCDGRGYVTVNSGWEAAR